ncbi:uncharacterized protein LOC110069676 [Orbicella faveolata]|uniref:uncharacterized protein LOC110069676 n=1 Tax=Orbicella faveolata TaxID=48498 RepID=UPI0009E53794|nr:uncharacterized protein LOC110069676 [Orbicella faveolata]
MESVIMKTGAMRLISHGSTGEMKTLNSYGKIVLNPELLDSLKYYARFRQTGSIECVNSLSLVCTPKRIPLSYRAYKVRKHLAAVDWNYHLHLPMATKTTGEQIFSRKYNQRTQQWDEKIAKANKGNEYFPLLITKMFHARMESVDLVARHVSLNESDPLWLITDPRLYYPPDQDQPRRSTRATPVACLWKTSRSSIPDTLVAERHPNLKEIVLIKLQETPREQDCDGKLKEILGSIEWTQTSFPLSCPRGMTRMNVSVLVQAVLEYLKDNPPITPQESNFQAELKAASHWYWFEENERMQFVSRHFDDMQLKKIAKLALERWTEKLNEIESEAQKLLSAKQGDSDDSDSSGGIEDEISDLEDSIFSLRMYYGKALEGADDDNLPSIGTHTSREDDRKPKIREVSIT